VPQRPPDEELPVYSVLIPLRNEASMVPQLFASMAALDYPALCIKRTKPIGA
jgi:cellulose synthase/poly-beta-1,6-N-acetylglucosamine synthase-like glycosyltransferase